MKKDFEKYLRTTKERFIRFIKQNKIQWNLSSKDTIEIEDFILAYESMYNELLSATQSSHPAQGDFGNPLDADAQKVLNQTYKDSLKKERWNAQGTSEITVDDFEEAMYSSPDTDDMKVAAQKCYALAIKMQGSQVDWEVLEKEFYSEFFVFDAPDDISYKAKKIFHWFKSHLNKQNLSDGR